MSPRWLLLLPLAALLAPSDAWALKPSKHRELAEAECARVGLPNAFCRRMGKADFETDYNEWDTLAAHAQREAGQDRCTAADASLARVDRLARLLVTQARAAKLEDAAITLGSALHTIQDECAHHGMTNAEHAYDSLKTTCGEDLSPDTRAEAISCAQRRTREVMAVVGPALATTNWTWVVSLCLQTGGDHDVDLCTSAALPTAFMACDFLHEHSAWDGTDTSWDPTKVGDALTAAFIAGLRNEGAPRSVCASGASAIDPPHPHATVRDLRAGCFSASLMCLGKADGQPDETLAGNEPAPDQGGCNGSGATSLSFLLLALLPLVRRRG